MPAPTTTIRLREPSSVVAVVPHVVGFQPAVGSLVIIGLHAGRVFGAARVDWDPEQAAGIEVSVRRSLSRTVAGPIDLLGVYYSDTDPVQGVVPAGLQDAFRDAIDLIQVGPKQYMTLRCDTDCCRPEPLPEASLTEVEMIATGSAPAASREEVAPLPPRATSSARQEATRGAERLLSRAQVMEILLQPNPTPYDMGGVVNTWRMSASTRDSVLAALAGAPAAVDGSDGAYFDWLVHIDVDRTRQAIARLQPYVAVLDAANLRSIVIAVQAMLSWASGQGAAATVLAERALELDPTNHLAFLISNVMAEGVPAPAVLLRLNQPGG